MVTELFYSQQGNCNRVGARIHVITGAVSWRFYCRVMVQQFGSENPGACWKPSLVATSRLDMEKGQSRIRTVVKIGAVSFLCPL